MHGILLIRYQTSCGVDIWGEKLPIRYYISANKMLVFWATKIQQNYLVFILNLHWVLGTVLSFRILRHYPRVADAPFPSLSRRQQPRYKTKIGKTMTLMENLLNSYTFSTLKQINLIQFSEKILDNLQKYPPPTKIPPPPTKIPPPPPHTHTHTHTHTHPPHHHHQTYNTSPMFYSTYFFQQNFHLD